jgi:ribonuclease HI
MRRDTPSRWVDLRTDGGCWPNPGTGCWAAILKLGEHTLYAWGVVPDRTNNQMEIEAAIQGLAVVKKPALVRVTSDSQYLVQTMQGRNQRKANHAHWQRLDAQIKRHEQVMWSWVPRAENAEADRLARFAQNTGLSGRCRDKPPWSHGSWIEFTTTNTAPKEIPDA